MKIIFIIVCNLLIGVYFCSAQQKPITKGQMYEDFDEFVQIIKECHPHIYVKTAYTGVDQLSLMLSLRNNIDTIMNQESFLNLLKMVLFLTYDGHSYEEKKTYHFDNLQNIDLNAINQYQKNPDSNSPKRRQNRISILGNPVYHKGNYYAIGSYTFIMNNESDTIHLLNPKIISFNGKPYSHYAMEETPFDVRWDYEKKRYYALTSYPNMDNIIVLEDSDKSIEIDFSSKCMVYRNNSKALPNMEEDMFLRKGRSNVSYLNKYNLLYIYLHAMTEDNMALSDIIKEIGAEKNIEKIIIDVRGNRGGNDLIWHNILKAIIANPLGYNPQAALLNSEKIKKYYRYPESPFKKIDSLQLCRFDWLPNTEFICPNFTGTYFEPDSNSLKYNGKIFILQDQYVYSSALALASFARYHEQLVSVGVPVGVVGGMGIAPAIFQLPHSKFTFRLSTLLDITNCENLQDIYHDTPEIEINIPLEDFLRYNTYKRIYNIQSEVFLTEYDYLFKKILEME